MLATKEAIENRRSIRRFKADPIPDAHLMELLDEQMVKNIFGWDDNICVVAFLPIGYPAENPKERKRLKLEEILID